MTPNEQIIHDLLTRQIDLMRYERSVRREVLQRLEAMRREVEDKLRGQNLDEMGRRELAALLADIETILHRDYDLISGSLNTADVVEDESEWLFVWLGGMAAMYGLPEPKRLPETHKQALQNGLLVGGLTIAEAFAGQRDALMSRIRAQVRMAAVGGSGWESLKTDLQAAFKRAIQHAETTTATWISTIANQTAYWAGKANPWVKGYRHISVLDSKTSSVCTNRHGKLWDKQKQPQGHDFEFRVPPIHPNCRSRLVWVADLGDNFQGVSGEDWVKGRTLAQLQEQFGKGIGQMLHDGTISLHDAVRRGGLAPMTLRELQEKYYTPNIAVAVDKAFAKFKAVEPAITQDIKTIATNAGAALGGLDYRLKTKASLARKVHADIVNEAISIKDALSKTNDVIRYTALLDTDSFFEQYRKINSALHNRGYNIVRVKNTWYDGAPYKGINTVIEKNGISFEMQYHTQASFDLKNGRLHELYEQQRLPDVPEAEKVRLMQEMVDLSAKLQTPPNIKLIR